MFLGHQHFRVTFDQHFKDNSFIFESSALNSWRHTNLEIFYLQAQGGFHPNFRFRAISKFNHLRFRVTPQICVLFKVKKTYLIDFFRTILRVEVVELFRGFMLGPSVTNKSYRKGEKCIWKSYAPVGQVGVWRAKIKLDQG